MLIAWPSQRGWFGAPIGWIDWSGGNAIPVPAAGGADDDKIRIGTIYGLVGEGNYANIGGGGF